jgi:Tfp pilus assembly protein PilO
MMARLIDRLAAVPPRTLLLAVTGFAVLVALEGLVLLRKPLAEYQSLRRERATLEVYARAPQQLAADIERGEREVAVLNGRLAGAGSQLAPDRMIVEVVDRLAGIAARDGSVLSGVRPAGVKRVLMFDEMAFDIEAAGAYRSLVAWLEDVERELGPLVVTQFSIKRGAAEGPLAMELRLAAYRLGDSGGAPK